MVSPKTFLALAITLATIGRGDCDDPNFHALERRDAKAYNDLYERENYFDQQVNKPRAELEPLGTLPFTFVHVIAGTLLLFDFTIFPLCCK